MNKEFFFCYSSELHSYIQRNNIKYVCAARHEDTYKKFWLYIKTDQLSKILKQYSLLNKHVQ